MNHCKITVSKKMVNQDLINEYIGEEFRDLGIFPCQRFEEGQESDAESCGTPRSGFSSPA